MAKYIDKDAVVAEIEELKTAIDIKLKSSKDSAYWKAQSLICERLEFKVNSLEGKEMDLEKHLKEDIEDVFFDLNGVAVKGATHFLTVEDVKDIAKHFFELGLKAQKL